MLSQSKKLLRCALVSASSTNVLVAKMPIAEGFSRPETARSTGAVVERKMHIDREKDRYTETVTEYESGTVIHHCDEKLSGHTGHGSAKKPKEK